MVEQIIGYGYVSALEHTPQCLKPSLIVLVRAKMVTKGAGCISPGCTPANEASSDGEFRLGTVEYISIIDSIHVLGVWLVDKGLVNVCIVTRRNLRN